MVEEEKEEEEGVEKSEEKINPDHPYDQLIEKREHELDIREVFFKERKAMEDQ